MLTGITLENFKAFKEPQFIPIKPITLVFGPNSAGKSSIIHALAFIRHVYLTNGHCDPREVCYGQTRIILGGFNELVYEHDTNATMKIGLHWENNSSKHSITWSFGCNGKSNLNQLQHPRVKEFVVQVDGHDCAKGENLSDRGIRWEIKVHSTHPIIQSFKNLVWSDIQNGKNEKFTSKQMLNRFTNIFENWKESQWHKIQECKSSNTFIPKVLIDPDVDFSKNLCKDIPF